jgi:hypothetical protein
VDALVNVIALINALLLAIPFALMGNIQIDNWDNIYKAVSGYTDLTTIVPKLACSSSDPNFHFDSVVSSVSSIVISVIYSAVLSLIIVLLYYLCKPQNVDDSEDATATDHVFWLDPEKVDHDFKALKDAIDSDDKYYTNVKFPLKSSLQRKLVLQKMRRDWEDPLKLIPAEVSLFRYQQWWAHGGRFLLWILLLFTSLSMILALATANYFFLYFVSPSPASGGYDYCAFKASRYDVFVKFFVGLLLFLLACFVIVA